MPFPSRSSSLIGSDAPQSSLPASELPSSRALPFLPIEIWARIFSYLPHPPTLFALSLTHSSFNAQLHSSDSQPLWRVLWDLSSSLSSAVLLSRPWALVPGNWRAQVAASRYLSLLPQTNHPFFCVPPRYTDEGQPLDQDRITTTPGALDVEEVLGRALCAVARGSGVVIGFEKGIGYVRRPARGGKPVLFYTDSTLIRNVTAIEMSAERGFLIAVCESRLLLRVDIKDGENVRWPLRWKVLDGFAMEAGNVTSIRVVEGVMGGVALLGFETGSIRVVQTEEGGCRRVFSMAESADFIAGNSRWVVGASSFEPICVCVWDVVQETIVHTFRRSSTGWSGAGTIAGICATENDDIFAVWDGRGAIHMLNVRTGEMGGVIKLRGSFEKGSGETAVEEAEVGEAAAHVGKGKLVLFKDRKRVAVATSNRVFVTPLSLQRRAAAEEPVKIEGAKRATLALSTDDRVLVSAEGDMFGGLSYKMVGRHFIGEKPRIRFWNAATGKNYGDLAAPSPVGSISLCGDTLAAVCGAVGQVLIGFATATGAQCGDNIKVLRRTV